MSAQWNSLDIALMTTTDICFSPPTLLHKFSSAFHFQWCLTTHTRFITARSGEGWDGKFKFLSIFFHPHPPHQLTEQSHPKDSTVASPLRNAWIPFNRIGNYLHKINSFSVWNIYCFEWFSEQFQLEWEGEKCEMKILQQLKCSSRKTSIKSELSEKVFSRLISSLFVDTLLTSSSRYGAMNSINFPKIKWDFRLLFVICCLAGMVNGFGARFGGWRNCLNLKFIDGERRRCRSWRWSSDRENSKETFSMIEFFYVFHSVKNDAGFSGCYSKIWLKRWRAVWENTRAQMRWQKSICFPSRPGSTSQFEQRILSSVLLYGGQILAHHRSSKIQCRLL